MTAYISSSAGWNLPADADASWAARQITGVYREGSVAERKAGETGVLGAFHDVVLLTQPAVVWREEANQSTRGRLGTLNTNSKPIFSQASNNSVTHVGRRRLCTL